MPSLLFFCLLASSGVRAAETTEHKTDFDLQRDSFGFANDTTLVYCFEKKGLLSDVNDESSVMTEVSQKDAEAMKANGTITKGMVPKIDNAFKAISNGVKTVVIGHAGDIKQITQKQKGYGTYIR